MDKSQAIRIRRLEENFAAIRALSGLTQSDVGELLGVTKQNIYGIERGATHIRQATYVAVRHFLDYRHRLNPSNKTLPMMVYLLVDCLEITGEDYVGLQKVAKEVASASSAMSGDTLYAFAKALLQAAYTASPTMETAPNPITSALERGVGIDWTAEIAADIFSK